jgi:lincosamide nucleotidyltransferase A/C/D/E
MTPEEVASIVDALESAGLTLWIDGGWGVDALPGRQLRDHDDLDSVVDIEDVSDVQRVLAAEGYTHQEGEAPLSFMVVDTKGRQVDVHPVSFNDNGDRLYEMGHGKTWTYPADGLAGRGRIGDREVRCLTPALQMRVHAGYELSDKDHDEVRVLHEHFGVDPPPGYEWP